MTDDNFIEVIKSASDKATEHKNKLKHGVLFDINESLQNVAALVNNLGLLRNGINKISDDILGFDLASCDIGDLPTCLHSMSQASKATSSLWTLTFLSIIEEYGCMATLSSLVANGGDTTEDELVGMLNKAMRFSNALNKALNDIGIDVESTE